MKVHAAVGLGNNSVMVRDVSCFCFKCFEGVKFCEESCCDGWEKHNLLKSKRRKVKQTVMFQSPRWHPKATKKKMLKWPNHLKRS